MLCRPRLLLAASLGRLLKVGALVSATGILIVMLIAPAKAQQRIGRPPATVPNTERTESPAGTLKVPETTSITIQQLEQFAKAEKDLASLQKRSEALESELRALRNKDGATSNLSSLRRLFDGIAQDFGKAVQAALFCSTARGTVDDGFNIRIVGAVRDRDDIEKVQNVLGQNPLYNLMRKSDLFYLDMQTDGGQSGGCVIQLSQNSNLHITKESKESFRFITHSALAKDHAMLSRIPQKAMCTEAGLLIAKLREDVSRVPVRQKILFNSFWVRDGDQLTLCREDGQDWKAAPPYLVKEGWSGLLILSRLN